MKNLIRTEKQQLTKHTFVGEHTRDSHKQTKFPHQQPKNAGLAFQNNTLLFQNNTEMLKNGNTKNQKNIPTIFLQINSDIMANNELYAEHHRKNERLK